MLITSAAIPPQELPDGSAVRRPVTIGQYISYVKAFQPLPLMNNDELTYRGWRRPGPAPAGGIEPEEGETLDYLCGRWKIFQFARGHRYSTDDVLTGWYGSSWAPRVERAADIGSGIGSVALVVAWRLPAARMVTVEAQEMSWKLARKSVRFNGVTERFDQRLGDLREPGMFASDEMFDLVTGSPPYFPPGTASEAAHAQAIPARIEIRGTVADYAMTAKRILAPGGAFSFVFPWNQRERAVQALAAAGLRLIRRRDVVFLEGKDPMISLFVAMRDEDLSPISPAVPWIEPPLVIRDREGRTSAEYAAIRLSFGLHPGNVPSSAG